jgi:hypothetical protein
MWRRRNQTPSPIRRLARRRHDPLVSETEIPMTTITEKIRIYSEDGDKEHPSEIIVTMNGSKPDCPITFWHDDKPIFSLGGCELDEFIEEIRKLDCT